MPRTFKDIAELEEFKTKELELPELRVLVPDALLYEVLAIQPGGAIGLRDDFIGHADHESAVRKFNHFFELAVEKKCDLVVSPEYSCPWESLENAIENKSLPEQGKLWVLGCEAITPEQLKGVTSNTAGAIWIHEPVPTTAGRFLNVLCYLFKTKSKAGTNKDIALLQFKTQPMVDADAWERDRLIVGETIYFLHNQDDYIRLMSLICSDSLEFEPFQNNEDCKLGRHPFLIFHPQLCLNPRHPAIQNYRNALFISEQSNSTEVLLLNWAHKFALAGRESPYGGSAIYLKSGKFNRADRTLDSNHKKGLYYANWQDQRTNICLLNFDEHVFHFRAQKVAMQGKAALANRTGPSMVALWRWNGETDKWTECETAEDGFSGLCDSYEEESMNWCVGDAFTSVDRERLLTLSAGKLEPELDWHEIQKLGSFIAEPDERTKRLTFVQEQSAESVGFRNEHIRRYIMLQRTIIPNAVNFPPNIQDLRGDCELNPPSQANGFRFNLKSKSGKAQGATGIFVGLQPPNYVKELRDRFETKWKKENVRRLVIWYEHKGTIRYSHPPLASVSDDSEHPASFVRTDKP